MANFGISFKVMPKKKKRGAPTERGAVPKPKARKKKADKTPSKAKSGGAKSPAAKKSGKKAGRGRPKKK